MYQKMSDELWTSIFGHSAHIVSCELKNENDSISLTSVFEKTMKQTIIDDFQDYNYINHPGVISVPRIGDSYSIFFTEDGENFYSYVFSVVDIRGDAVFDGWKLPVTAPVIPLEYKVPGWFKINEKNTKWRVISGKICRRIIFKKN